MCMCVPTNVSSARMIGNDNENTNDDEYDDEALDEVDLLFEL